MTTLARAIGRVVQEDELSQAGIEYCHAMRIFIEAKGSLFAAAQLAREKRSLPRIREYFEKAVANPGGIGSWGAPLAAAEPLEAGFLESVRAFGVFDKAMPSCCRSRSMVKSPPSLWALLAGRLVNRRQK